MFDMNNKSNWNSVLSRLKVQLGVVDKLEFDNHLSDSAFRKKVVETIEDASCQYRSLTGARYKGPDFDRIFQEDKLRLQRTEQLVEKMLCARPLAYDLSVFEKWSSDNKVNILLRVQSIRSTPICTGNQNVFHVFAHQSGPYWLNEWYKNRHYISDHIASCWLNQLSDFGHTPLQLFWLEIIKTLSRKEEYSGIFLDEKEINSISCATTLVLGNDWGVLDPINPKSIAQQWDCVKSNAGLFPEIEAMISKKKLNDVIKDVVGDACSSTSRKI